MKRRAPAVVPQTLLAYTHLGEIRRCIAKLNWDQFSPALGKKKDFDVLLDQVDDYRNASAHSRELLGHERAFLEGIAGIIRTKVTMHRSAMDSNRKHYPVIESVRDSFGNAATQLDPNGIATLETHITLQVGDVVTFEANGWDAQGRDLSWRIGKAMVGRQMDTATGNAVTMNWTVEESDVAETVLIAIEVKSSGQFHRSGSNDQTTWFSYCVEPPTQ